MIPPKQKRDVISYFTSLGTISYITTRSAMFFKNSRISKDEKIVYTYFFGNLKIQNILRCAEFPMQSSCKKLLIV